MTPVQRIALEYIRARKLRQEHDACVFVRPERSRWSEELQRIVYYGMKTEYANRNCEHAHPYTGCCVHGVYVGGCGADYMCGICESGASLYEQALSFAWKEFRRQHQRARREFIEKTRDMLFKACSNMPTWAVKRTCEAWTILIEERN